MTYRSRIAQLEPLQTFAGDAFRADETVSQSACDLVLALALVFNDLRDVVMAHQLLSESAPTNDRRATTELGLFNGLRTALLRAQSGVVHELLVLIKDHSPTLAEPFMRELVARLGKRGRPAWNVLCDVASGKANADPFARTLVRVRNKVAFHYDPAELGRGYWRAFGPDARHGEPVISRGDGLWRTRFYFADAAAQAYMFDKAKDEAARAFLLGESRLFDIMHLALYEIVTRFIQARGVAWRECQLGDLPDGYGLE